VPIYLCKLTCFLGLAEALRSEMLLYGIDIHMFFPATIYSPGYENENKTKPEITLKIEERDPGFKPEVYAEELLKGKSYLFLSAKRS
jgi:3-dehydrosphinganine reductase